MEDRTRWILATICIICCTLFFDLGWTFPFITVGILSIEIIKLTLPPILSIFAGVFFVLAILLIRKTANPAHEPLDSEKSFDDS